MDEYSSVIKGGSSLKKSLKKTKPVAKPSAAEAEPAATVQAKPIKVVKKPTKTAAELAAEKARQRIQSERLKELAKKSHKDRVADFNDYLSKLSEHHDIPKVGPG